MKVLLILLALFFIGCSTNDSKRKPQERFRPSLDKNQR
jgi:hypothetical protein